jgi:hypothetical protein
VREPLVGPSHEADLLAVAVNPRDLKRAEYRESIPLRQFYNDMSTAMTSGAGDKGVNDDGVSVIAVNRIRRDSAIKALDAFRALFFTDAASASATQRVDHVVDQASLIRRDLATGWKAYVANQKKNVTGKGFKVFLDQHKDAFASPLDKVQRLTKLLGKLSKIGVTELEFERIVKVIIKPILPAEMSAAQLRDALGAPQALSMQEVKSKTESKVQSAK